MATKTAQKKSKSEVSVIDLAVKANRHAMSNEGRGERLHRDLAKYLTTGVVDFVYGKIKLLDSFEEYATVAILPDGRVYGVEFPIGAETKFIDLLTWSDLKVGHEGEIPGGMVVNCQKRMGANVGLKELILLNGDVYDYGPENNSPDYELVGEFSALGLPTTSFQCLSRFYQTDEALVRLSNNKLKLIDYTVDEHRDLTKEDKNILRRKKDNIPKPPEAGFSLVSNNNKWHRSGTTLFWDQEKEICLLLGQDEGTYFGVRLPKKAKNIADAYTILMPKGVGDNYKRQGEWFMVPVEESEVPLVPECVVEADEIVLPRDHEDSNDHRVRAAHIRVNKNHVIFAFHPNVEHEEHAEIKGMGWYKFIKNTALEAYSQQGVD